MTDAMVRALIVEDDPDIRAIVRTLLEAEGFRVVQAGSAARPAVEARGH